MITSKVQTPSSTLTSMQDQLKMALKKAMKATKAIRFAAMLATRGMAVTTPSMAACRTFASVLFEFEI